MTVMNTEKDLPRNESHQGQLLHGNTDNDHPGSKS